MGGIFPTVQFNKCTDFFRFTLIIPLTFILFHYSLLLELVRFSSSSSSSSIVCSFVFVLFCFFALLILAGCPFSIDLLIC